MTVFFFHVDRPGCGSEEPFSLWDSPNQACWSPWTSMASPKSASFTAAFLHLLASSRFSGCRWRKTPQDRVRTVHQGAALPRLSESNLQTVPTAQNKQNNNNNRLEEHFSSESIFTLRCGKKKRKKFSWLKFDFFSKWKFGFIENVYCIYWGGCQTHFGWGATFNPSVLKWAGPVT